MVASGISGLFISSPMRGMEQMLQNGDFDMVLIRPMDSLFYTIIGCPNFTSTSALILGTGVFILCFTHLAIHITILKIVFLLAAILGAALIQTAILVVIGTMSFWLVKNTATYSLLNCFNNFLDYPITIYARSIQAFLTFVIPVAFVNFYPAHYFLNKTGDNLFFPALQYGTPVVGLVMFFMAYQFWKIGVNKYESTGS
jgi:ABC-2 type transport system permease protein